MEVKPEKKPCCRGAVAIDGIYKPLSLRLLELGKDAYKDTTGSHRVIMWVYSFYNAKDECPVCKGGLERLYGWFMKYGVLDNPAREVRIVIDDEASTSAILDDMHVDFAPVNIFADSEGRIIDMVFEYPDEWWLDRYILPFIQQDSGIL